jgi:uncharacterized phage protein gp47/JayE
MADTYEEVMDRLLDLVPDTMDKREGSIIYDALAPAAMEIALCYQEIEGVMMETFADTASRGYLIRRAAERGVEPEQPTQAVVKGVFTPTNLDLIGARFNLGDYNYVVFELIEAGQYKLRCETYGTAGNVSSGTLIPIDYIAGLQTASVTELLIPAQNEESTESLREKYFYSVNNIPFGGNKAGYKELVEEYDGVGACKVIPVWNGGGTVKIIILDASMGSPSSTLVDEIQTFLDPIQNSGEGVGMAPIGHVVTVVGAGTTSINVSSEFSFQTGYDFATCLPQLQAAMDEYLETVSATWANTENCIVRISQLESRFLDCDGILDVQGTMLNGTAANLQIASDKVPVRGTITDAS